MQKQATAEPSPATTAPAEQPSAEAKLDIDLRDPWLAAFLAWLIPGMGHFYQRRWAKGVLFSVCILGTFLYGLSIGGGKVVYAAFPFEDRWLHYFCQTGVGLPAMPALVQKMRVRNGGKPFGTFMAPPDPTVINDGTPHTELDDWHYELHRNFELGTIFTMIAGLLNVLAIFDAGAGPVIVVPAPKKKKKTEGESPPDEQDGKERRLSKLDSAFGLGGLGIGFYAAGWIRHAYGPFGMLDTYLIIGLCSAGGVFVIGGGFVLIRRLVSRSTDVSK